MNKNFTLMRESLQNILQKYDLEESYTIESIKNNWETLVNENIYKLLKPIRLEHQILYLKVKTNYWKEEFVKIKEQIIKEINKNIDSKKIKDIKFL